MNNKIGILTYQDTSNFGAMLQAFGLYAYLKKKGYSCKIINYKSKSIDKRENPQNILYELKKVKNLKSKLFILLSRSNRKKKYMGLKNFLMKQEVLTLEYTRENIKLINKDFDTFIVGSDMVWNFTINNNDFAFLLDFVNENKKKISFASSLGEEWSNSIDTTVKQLFKRFNHISIREEQFKTYLEQKLEKKVDIVCDPTMLITANEWLEYTVKPTYDNYVLVYFNTDDSKCLNNAIEYARDNGYSVKYISLSIKKNSNYDSIWPTTIEQFLGLIKNAKAVFTASYHGMLFSIYFEKELFWYSRAQNSRMKFISEKLGLVKRCGSEIDLQKMPKIDFNSVKMKLSEFRNYSENILDSYLGEL